MLLCWTLLTSHRKCKINLQDILQILTALRRAKEMQVELETHVNEENFFKVHLFSRIIFMSFSLASS